MVNQLENSTPEKIEDFFPRNDQYPPLIQTIPSNTHTMSSVAHVHRVMDLKRSSPTPDAPKKSRMTSPIPFADLDTARIAGIRAVAAMMMEPTPFIPINWIKKNV